MTRLEELEAMLRARAGKLEYRDSIAPIRAGIARLKALETGTRPNERDGPDGR